MLYTDIRRKMAPSRPAFQDHLKVIGTATDRSATHDFLDFLLVTRSNYVTLVLFVR